MTRATFVTSKRRATARTTMPRVFAVRSAPADLEPSQFVTSTTMALWLPPGSLYDATTFIWEGRSAAGVATNHFIATRDAPTITYAWLDGQNGVTFDGTLKQVLRCGCFTGIGKGDKPCALIVASVNNDHPAGTPTLLYLAAKNPLVSSNLVFNVTVGAVSGLAANVRLGSGGTASNATASGAGGYANGVPRLFMAVASNASNRSEIWEGNTLRGTAASGASGGLFATPTHAVIGSGDEGGGTTRWFDGTIGEVLMFRNKPTTAELRALYRGYYASVWPTIYAGLA